MRFVNPNESWSSKQEIFGYDQQILFRHLPIVVIFHELLVHKLPWKATCEVKGQKAQDRGSHEVEDSTSTSCSAWQEWKAQTAHVNPPVGSQVAGTVRTKVGRPRQGSRSTSGNEVIFLEPQNKGTHGRRKQRLFVTEYIFSPFLPLVMLP